MGSPPTFIGQIRMLYMDVSSKVLVNCFLSMQIAIELGVHQGCLLPPILFICAIEPLAQHIRQNSMMIHVQIPSGSKEETRLLAYMDDLNILCWNKRSEKKGLWHTQVYKAAAGPKLNMSKSTCLAMGKLEDLESLGVLVSHEGVKIRVGFDPELSGKTAWEKEIKVKWRLGLWHVCHLSMVEGTWRS
ncbi:hypothetical protein Y1Q_0005441 [Alligator mississippiensis]|uniref:Reverse transcriptase domain-containing protein n=1 Tax=Alligator mississippiensis TaxID=8496 RepID=A0A151MEH3_ALLMI|nr:hypothetical protein Y1Q_0005441 [Alligator mississippiensis]